MNHRWNIEHRIPACESPDGNERTEKTCPFWACRGVNGAPRMARQLIGANVPHGCVGNAPVSVPPTEVAAI